jgi:UDP-N-acetylmuramate--alanine ligase
MLGVLLQNAGLDPTVFVGGEVAELGGNVRVGSEDGPFVAEACEAYDSFLSLKPDIAVLTNVEADHLDHYGTAERVQASFVRFLQNLRPGGTIVACADDPGAKEVLGHFLSAASLTYGMTDPDAQMHAHSLQLDAQTAFTWGDPVVSLYDTRIVLNVPGRHNVLNALAAASVAMLLHVPVAAIAEGLRAFHGATRRQEILGAAAMESGDVLVMDDYAHHPTEIRATLDALRGAYPQRRLVAVFQPHLYSRTRDFLAQFAEALALADAVVVTDIYAARETPLEGVRASDIVNLAAKLNPEAPMLYLPDKTDIPDKLAALVRPGDLTLFLGAGDIRTQGERFLKLLQEGSAVQ